MPKVTFLANKITPTLEVEVEEGTTLLEAALRVDAPVGHSCGGVCACSTCHIYVREGASTLSEQEDSEADRLDMAFQVKPSSRLSCQSEVFGDVQVEITPESLKAFLDENPKLRRELEAKGIVV